MCYFILLAQMIEKKYNSRTGQPLLTAVKLLFFAIHHSGKEACRCPDMQKFTIFLKSLK